MLTAQAREAAIVTITQRQATTASRNARVTRYLKQDPTRLYKDTTSSLPDATSSLKRRTRECSFREKKLFSHAETHRGYGQLQLKQGVVPPDVWSPLDTGRTTTAVVPPARESSEERVQLIEFTRSAEVRSRTMYPLGSKAKT